MSIAKPVFVLISVIVVSWILLMASFYGMELIFNHIEGLHGLFIQIIRDLLGFLLIVAWAILFYLMRQVAAKALNLQ